jgi:arginase
MVMTHDRRHFMKLFGATLVAPTLRAGAEPVARKVGIVGVPFNSAGLASGVARAPAALRAHGLVEHLSAVCDARDYGDVTFAPLRPERDAASGIKSLAATESMVPAVQVAVEQVLTDGRFPLVLGGDCPVMLGGLAAAHRRWGRVGLIFVDGHEDAYPPHASTTGESADMELGFALGLYLETAPKEFARRFPVVRSSDTVIIGARDAADIKRDKTASLASKVRMISDAQAQSQDCAEIARREQARLEANGVGGVWLHTDLDVLSSAALPAVDYPQPGGFSWPQLTSVVRSALSRPSTIGWDVTIYNPDLDRQEAHAGAIVQFIAAAFNI